MPMKVPNTKFSPEFNAVGLPMALLHGTLLRMLIFKGLLDEDLTGQFLESLRGIADKEDKTTSEFMNQLVTAIEDVIASPTVQS
jgi:hypothetical protein